MRLWPNVLVAVLLALTAGCSSAKPPEAPAPDPAPVALTDDERYRKYDQLRHSTAGIPYVTMWAFDGQLNKLVIHVGTQEAKQSVQREVAKLGLPPESVAIEHPEQLLSEAAPFAGCQSTRRPADAGDGGLKLPEVMKAGQEFDLTIALNVHPDQIMRGVDSYLECWDGAEWSTRFMLHVGHGTRDGKPMARIIGSNPIEDVGFSGPGPERLVLPEQIPPGWYRIRKQVHAGTNSHTLTALFEVREP